MLTEKDRRVIAGIISAHRMEIFSFSPFIINCVCLLSRSRKDEAMGLLGGIVQEIARYFGLMNLFEGELRTSCQELENHPSFIKASLLNHVPLSGGPLAVLYNKAIEETAWRAAERLSGQRAA